MKRSTEELTALIPAAGFSGRVFEKTGIPKIIIPVNGQPWIFRQLTWMATCGLKTAVLVLGYHYSYILRCCPFMSGPFSWKGMSVRPVVNPCPERGPFSSIQTGLNEIYRLGIEHGVLLNPVDVPAPDVSLYEKLRDSSPAYSAVIPQFQGKRGHPVALNAKFWMRLIHIRPDASGARLDHLIRKEPDEMIKFISSSSCSVLRNLNKPGDFRAMLPKYQSEIS